jgi:hypothetical protein
MTKTNLMNDAHKASTPESREGFDVTFGRRCEYHTGRAGTVCHQGIWLCDACLGELALRRKEYE